MTSRFPTRRVLGIDFFQGTAEEAVAAINAAGGLLVAPAAPSMVALHDDPAYRSAVKEADLAIADSGWLVVFWRILTGETLTRISGLTLFRTLMTTPEAQKSGNVFWVLPTTASIGKTKQYALAAGLPLAPEDLYCAPVYGKVVEDASLANLLESRRPRHVVIAIGGGKQDKLGAWLKRRLSYRPALYCIGAAPGFVTGDLVTIPVWADRLYLGWLLRLMTQPRIFLPRFWSVRRLPMLLRRYGRETPVGGNEST